VCWNVVAWSHCFIIGKIQVHSIFKNPNSPTIHLESRNIEWPRVNGCLIFFLLNTCFCYPFCVSYVVSFWLPCLEYVMNEMFGFELWSTNNSYCLLLNFLFISQVSLEFFFIHKGTWYFLPEFIVSM
jgi:hypothetical protein